MTDDPRERSGGSRPRTGSRRAVSIVAVLAVAAVVILALLWDHLAVLWRAGRLELDPRALCRAALLERGTADARAALVCLRADDLGARFAAEVAGHEWRVSTVGRVTILPAPRYDSSLSFERTAGGYRVDFALSAHGSAGGGPATTTTSESRLVELRGPFVIDLETPGRADTWGVAGGVLFWPAAAPVGERAWLSVWSQRSGDLITHSFRFVELDGEPVAGTEGTCRHAANLNARDPVIHRLGEILGGDLPRVPFVAEPAGEGAVHVRIATKPETLLIIQDRTRTAWYGTLRRDGTVEDPRWTMSPDSPAAARRDRDGSPGETQLSKSPPEQP